MFRFFRRLNKGLKVLALLESVVEHADGHRVNRAWLHFVGRARLAAEGKAPLYYESGSEEAKVLWSIVVLLDGALRVVGGLLRPRSSSASRGDCDGDDCGCSLRKQKFEYVEGE
jgi:hypothetical protein